MSAKHSRSTRPARSPAEPPAPPLARTRHHVLRSSTIGALPVLNEFLRRMRLEDFLRSALPPELLRTGRSTVQLRWATRSPSASLRWRGRHLSGLKGQQVRIRFHLKDGDLYSFWLEP